MSTTSLLASSQPNFNGYWQGVPKKADGTVDVKALGSNYQEYFKVSLGYYQQLNGLSQDKQQALAVIAKQQGLSETSDLQYQLDSQKIRNDATYIQIRADLNGKSKNDLKAIYSDTTKSMSERQIAYLKSLSKDQQMEFSLSSAPTYLRLVANMMANGRNAATAQYKKIFSDFMTRMQTEDPGAAQAREDAEKADQAANQAVAFAGLDDVDEA